jgi:putative ABC transport system permease protein
MTGLRLDLRDTWRRLRRAPVGTLVAVLTLALGIAATTAVFALVYGGLFRPIAGADLDGVFAFSHSDLRGRDVPVRESEFRAIVSAPPAGVRALGAVSDGWLGTLGRNPGRADQLVIQGMSGDAVALLGLHPSVGRWFAAEEDRAVGVEATAVVSHRVALDWFGSATGAVGRTLQLGDARVRIIGVAAPEFPGLGGVMMATDVWVPLAQLPSTLSARTREWQIDRWGFPVTALVRIEDGADPAAVASLLRRQHAGGELQPGSRASLWPVPTTPLSNASSRRAASLMLILSAFALMAACANLANLLFSKQTARAGELALRVSLGASRLALIRSAAVEATTIALLAAFPGFALAVGAVSLFETTLAAGGIGPSGQTLVMTFPIDGAVFAYGVGAGLLAALVVSTLTAVHTTRLDLLHTLAGAAATSTGLTVAGRRMRTALVAVQVTAAVVLLMGTGVVFERARSATDAGLSVAYDTDQLTVGRLDMVVDNINDTRGRELFDRVWRSVSRMPGVERAAIVDELPGAASGGRRRGLITADALSRFPNGQRRAAEVDFVRATPGLPETLGLRVLGGRGLMPSDVDGGPLVAVLSASAADALWPGVDAVGRQLRLGGDPREVTVVGVVEDAVRGRWNSRVEQTAENVPSTRPSNAVIVPFAQHYTRQAWVVVRSATPIAQVAPLRAAVAEVDPTLPLLRVTPAERLLDWLGPTRAIVSLVVALGLVAVGLTVLGVFGVVSFFVSLRTREFGVRLALGATRGRVLKMVVDYGVHIMLVGLLPGVFVAAIGSRILESRIISLMPNDITTWVVVPTAILGLGILAALVPAWRASRIDPQAALRDL